jgi:hypothetical protein
VGYLFRGYAGSLQLRPARLLASPDGSDWHTRPATGGFYVQAFDGAVTLTVAGYNYDIDWPPMSAGLAPAGMAASFAARLPQVAANLLQRHSRQPWVANGHPASRNPRAVAPTGAMFLSGLDSVTDSPSTVSNFSSPSSSITRISTVPPRPGVIVTFAITRVPQMWVKNGSSVDAALPSDAATIDGWVDATCSPGPLAPTSVSIPANAFEYARLSKPKSSRVSRTPVPSASSSRPPT